MQRKQIATREVVVPSGYTLTIKDKLSWGDERKVQIKALGGAEVDGAGKINFEQSFNWLSANTKKKIIAWDVTEEDGTPTPLTDENIDEILSQEDADFLAKQLVVETDPKS